MKKEKLIKNISTILFVLFFSALGFFGTYFLSERVGAITGANIVYTILILGFSFPLHVILHETGHLLGGLIGGYQFIMFRLFDTVWIQTKEGISKRKQYIPGVMGQALMIPPKENKKQKFNLLLYHASGMLMNVLTLFIFILIGKLTSIDMITYTLYVSAFVAFFIILISALPAQGTDGYNIVQTFKHEEIESNITNLLYMYRDMVLGVSFKELQRYTNLDNISSLQDPTAVNQYSIRAAYLLETGKYLQALEIQQMLYKNRKKLFQGHQPDILLNYFFNLLLVDPTHPDVKEIKHTKVYKKYKKISQADYIRIYAAEALFLNKDYETTEKLLRKGKKYIHLAPTVTEEKFEEQMYQSLENELRQKSS